MASLTIRNLEDEVKARLRVRAARRGRSMEEEAREILREAVSDADGSTESLADVLRDRFADLHGVELELPDRDAIRTPPDLDA